MTFGEHRFSSTSTRSHNFTAVGSWARALLAALLLCVNPASAAPAVPPPNLLFILADDLGYGDLGCYGAPDIRTPRLDALAAHGMRFTDAYANGPTCSPTRYAFITGRYQQRGGLEYALYYQEKDAGLPPGGETLPRLLSDAGWHTALIGKWHLGYDAPRAPNAQGFQHFFGLLGGNHHYFQHMDRLGHHDLFLNGEAVKREGYSTDLFTDDAIRFLREPRDRPFFLFLSHPAPHFPYQGPGDAARTVEPKSKSWQSGTRANYVSMVEHLDQSVGRVLDELDRLDLATSTLVVFTSDNGGDPMGRNLPLSGFKGTLSEGGIRVPCFARWPGLIPAGKTSATPILTMDWTATFLALADVTRRESADGVNLLPLLRGDSDALPPANSSGGVCRNRCAAKSCRNAPSAPDSGNTSKNKTSRHAFSISPPISRNPGTSPAIIPTSAPDSAPNSTPGKPPCPPATHPLRRSSAKTDSSRSSPIPSATGSAALAEVARPSRG